MLSSIPKTVFGMLPPCHINRVTVECSSTAEEKQEPPASVVFVMSAKVSLEDTVKQIGGRPFSPVEVARANDQVVRMSLVQGEFHWHKHANEDELFFVYRGSIEIQYKDRPNVVLNEGEMSVVPRGVEHCPRSSEPSYVLLFEPHRLDTRGE